jgi:hypothetical protein
MQGVAWQHGSERQGPGRRPALTAPARGASLAPQVGTKERPPVTNKGTELGGAIDDVA